MMLRLLVALLMLAGCADAALDPPRDPIHDGDPPREPFKTKHEGPMLEGVDEAWNFTVHSNATSFRLQLAVTPVGGNIGRVGLEVIVRHNQSVVEQIESNGFILVGATDRTLVEMAAHEPEDDLRAWMGDWAVALKGGPQVGGYLFTSEVRYR